MLIRGSRHSFGSESQFRCTTHNSAANANSLQKTQFRHRITNSLQTTQFRRRMLIRCSRHSFGSESQFRCTIHNSAGNANSVVPMESLLGKEEVWSRQTGITVIKGHNFWSDCLIALKVFTVVSRGCFPCSTYGIPIRWRGRIAAPDLNNSWKEP